MATVAVTSQPISEATTEATSDGSTRVARDGDQVRVHYRGTLADGSVFDSSHEREPLPFQVGSGGVIAGFDNAVRGLAIGESVTVTIPPAEAYGERSEDRVLDIPVEGAPDGLAVGDRVQLANGAQAVVLEISDDFVKVDANHGLAGMALTFAIELVSIE
jgi:peptidylprolyl isomerase